MKKIFTLLLVALTAMTVSAKQLYFVGNAPVGTVEGDAGWGFDADHQLPLALDADGVTNTASLDITGQAWFCISDGPGTSWDDFNANHRYSCANFNSKQSGTYQFEKLGDSALSLEAGHYEISINSETMIMTLTYTEAAAPTTDTYSVVGDVALGLEWNPASEDIIMNQLSDTQYELVRENVTLKAETPYYWRILKNATTYGWGADRYGASGFNAGEGDDNVISYFDEDGIYNLTFTLDLSNGNASIPTVTAVKAGEASKNYIFVDDQTGFSTLKVYAWGDDGELFGSWGTTTVGDGESVDVDGTIYKKLPFFTGTGYSHLIFFNGDEDTGGDDPTRAMIDIPSNEDAYIKVEPGNAVEVNPAATGISTISMEQPANDSATYDLQGRRVSKGYRGIIVRGGKKLVN